MTARSILRLQLFRFGERSAEIDVLLRDELLPAMLALDGLLDAFVARQDGAAAAGDIRVVASVWESLEAMDAALGEGPLAPIQVRRQGDIQGLRVEVLPVAFELRIDRIERPSILRIYQGTTRPACLDAYVAEARAGTLADATDNDGLLGLYLATNPPDRFVTVSAWTGWPAIERATGSNIRRPNATRNSPLLASGDAGHYEILPGTARPLSRIPAGSGAGFVPGSTAASV